VTFTHPLLRRPITDLEQVDFIARLALHRAELPLTHEYTGKQSTGGDNRLLDRGLLGSNYVGRD
jgi:hypothetical protein